MSLNKLKKFLKGYLKSGMWKCEAPLIGKDEVKMILDVFDAFDEAVELLYENMSCEKCPFPKNKERCIASRCKDYMRECLLEGNKDSSKPV